MGLIARARHRLGVWNWRLRYWWLDTEGGEQAHIALFCLSVLVVIVQLVRMFVEAALPTPPDQVVVVKSVYWWVVQLIIAIVAAIVSYAMRPKPKPPQAQKNEAPSTEDGLSVKHHGGTCWVGDEFIQVWKPLKPVPIKKKSGKK